MSDVVEKMAWANHEAITRAFAANRNLSGEEARRIGALAALDALAESVTPEMIEEARATFSIASHSNQWTNYESTRQAIRAAILAAKG